MYESPISMLFTEPIYKAIQDEQGKVVVRAVQRMGVDVNEKELIKALAYDRGQYEKGFSDGIEESRIGLVRDGYKYPCVYCTEDLHCEKYAEPGYESWCVLGPCSSETPANGDLVRRKSDEELADFIWQLQNTKERLSTNSWLEWLKQAAWENKDG